MQGNLRILQDELLKKHTTFKIGGACKYLLCPLNENGVLEAINFAKDHKLPYTILGNGSNVLAGDDGYNGAVIKLTSLDGISLDGNILHVKAGQLLYKVGNFCLNHELTGFEKLSGIPGTIGGAIVMNAGAYGGEISDILVASTYMDADGKIVKLCKKDHDFAYRHSFYAKNPQFIILSAEFELKNAPKEQIKAVMDDCRQKRQEKQPLNYPNAGSTFKRPVGNFAGKLIEDAGLKGYRVGGACVSEKHAGFVINDQNATCQDVLTLINNVKKQVLDKYDVKLECEIKTIGE